ncbi:MAG: hypothetical protein HYY24_24670 [Verrucomicrobia bacterium]|nr:hypothetical protein [Verrucomicrobiota bacterium]
MEPKVAFKVVEEIRQQCRFAQFAWQNLRTSLQSVDAEKTFFYVHAALDHALAVARLLWPAREASSARGEWLRKELRVPDDSPLRLREVREALERSDESFEDWLASLENTNYVDMNIMPQMAIGAFKQDTFQRSLDPDTQKLVLWGAACDLRSVANALRELDGAASTWLRAHTQW